LSRRGRQDRGAKRLTAKSMAYSPALRQFVDKRYVEGAAVLDTVRFRKGVLVGSDGHLARFLKYVDNFSCTEPLVT
jgi:hypothetical protein